MGARVVEVDGQETDRSETCHLGRDQAGYMDAVRAGIWDIVQALVQWFRHFQLMLICRRYRIKKRLLRNNSRIFRIACGASRNDCRKFKSENKIQSNLDIPRVDCY
jgi:hypothetical protein